MKSILFQTMRIVLGVAALLLSTDATLHAASDQEAVKVVSSYLDAVQSGDLETMKQLMSRRLLKDRRSRMDNPSYSGFLQRFYAGSTYEITRVKPIKNGKMLVDAKVVWGSDNAITSRYVLTHDNERYLIESEN